MKSLLKTLVVVAVVVAMAVWTCVSPWSALLATSTVGSIFLACSADEDDSDE